MRVKSFGEVATFVVYRSDGHELSLSSMSNSLTEFCGNLVVQDYGQCYNVAEFLRIATEFLKGENQ